MANEKAELLLHPTRLRIVLALAGTEMTTGELADGLPDVPPATLYRQVATLVRGGLLEIASEEQKRGSVERTYRIVESAATLGPEEASSMSAEEHMTGFIAFVGALVQSFGRYLESDAADDNDFSYRQAGIWATASERKRLSADLRRTLAPYLDRKPGRGRSKVSLSTIIIPDIS